MEIEISSDAASHSGAAKRSSSFVPGRPEVLAAPQTRSPMQPCHLSGRIRSYRGLSKHAGARGDWRNSLVAVDNENGDIVGVLAHGVNLEGRDSSPPPPPPPHSKGAGNSHRAEHRDGSQDDDDDDDDDKDVDEVNTPHAGEEPRILFYSGENKSSPTDKPKYTAAHTYYDPDVRPSSRAGSVLGEDTFAPPPPPPVKPQHLCGKQGKLPRHERPFRTHASTGSLHSHAADETTVGSSSKEAGSEEEVHGDSDGEAVDGRVRTRAMHVEAHRPDLLRDTAQACVDDDNDDARSDASGSTVGGPVIQLWNRARGGKKGAARRQAGRDAKRESATLSQAPGEDGGTLQAEAAHTEGGKEASCSSDSKTANRHVIPTDMPSASQIVCENTSGMGINASPESVPVSDTVKSYLRSGSGGHLPRAWMATSQLRSAEDRVWQEALESESLPIDGAYTHMAIISADARPRSLDKKKDRGPASSPVNLSAAPTQGNSVLINFLAGSQMVASIIQDATASVFAPEGNHAESPSDVSASPPPDQQQDAFSPTNIAVVPRSGAWAYIPILPSHLLQYFTISGPAPASDDEQKRMAGGRDVASLRGAPSPPDAVITTMGADLLQLVPAAGPATTFVVNAASRSASMAWTAVRSMTGWSIEAGTWLGSALANASGLADGALSGASAQYKSRKDVRKAGISEPCENEELSPRAFLDQTEPGDEDAAEWEWSVPTYNEDTLDNTPRPVYRRRRPMPCAQAGFRVHHHHHHNNNNNDDNNNNAGGASDCAGAGAGAGAEAGRDERMNTPPMAAALLDGEATVAVRQHARGHSHHAERYTIVHFDQYGVGRHALLRAPV